MSSKQAAKVDFIEAGSSGPHVMLVHSSAAGARQWRRLIDHLKSNFRVRAVNLFGYGMTPPWPTEMPQTLNDQAKLVEAALPVTDESVYLVGHSFGGSVAMKVAARLGRRVSKLALLETNPFYLLAQARRNEAFNEAMALRNCIKTYGGRGDWMTAAETFADYWNGPGTWRDMSQERRATFSDLLKPNFNEWDAVMDETTPVQAWSDLLPQTTVQFVDPKTVRPIREISIILRERCPHWGYVEVPGGGHMAPLTRPDLINALIQTYLKM